MIKGKKNLRAFTLIEVLLYVGIAGIVLASLVGFGWNMIGIGVKSGAHADVVSNARLASEKLSFFIREATDIDVANSNFGTNLATAPGSKVTLRGVLPNDPIIFDVSGGALRVKIGTGLPVALTSTAIAVNSLVFVNASSADGKTKNIGYEIQLGSVSSSNRFEYVSATSVRSSAEIRSNTQ